MKLHLLIAALPLGGCGEVPARSDYSTVSPIVTSPKIIPVKTPVKVSASTAGYTYGVSGAGHYPTVTDKVTGVTYAAYTK